MNYNATCRLLRSMKLTLWMNNFSCAIYTGKSTFRIEQVMKPFFFMLNGSYYKKKKIE